MKVVLLSGWYYPDSVGGTENYVRILARDLQSLGCRVTVAAPAAEREMRYVHEGVEVYRYPMPRVSSKEEARGEAAPRHFDVFDGWLRAAQPDVVHLHSFGTGCGLHHARAAKALGKPLFFTVHVPGPVCARGTMMRWGSVPCDGKMDPGRCAACYLQFRGMPRHAASALMALSEWVWPPLPGAAGTVAGMRAAIRRKKTALREITALSDRVFVVSRWLYETLRLNGVSEERMTVVRHGLPASEFARPPRGTRTGPLRIGYWGRFTPSKGVHVLIEAARRLPAGTPFELKVCGTASPDAEGAAYLDRLRRLASDDPRISFPAAVSPSERTDVFSKLDILAVPSVWFETGPLVVLEAFVAGLPVIGSDLGGIREWVQAGSNGVLVKPGDVRAWTRALEELAADRARVERLARGVPDVPESRLIAEKMITAYRAAAAVRA